MARQRRFNERAVVRTRLCLVSRCCSARHEQNDRCTRVRDTDIRVRGERARRTHVRVTYAGSMDVVMDEGLGPAFALQNPVRHQVQSVYMLVCVLLLSLFFSDQMNRYRCSAILML
jgi:hypothetical protein